MKNIITCLFCWLCLTAGARSVKDCGAIGDGVTDDTAAVQAVLNTETDIYFPRGTYLVGNLLVRSSDNLIHGEGFASVLLLKPGATGPLLNVGEHTVGMEKLAFYGGDTTDKSTTAISPADRSAIAIRTQSPSWIDKILVKGFGRYWVYSTDLWRDAGSHLSLTNSTFIFNWTAIQAGPENAEYIRLSGLDIRNSWIALYLGSGNITVTNSKITTNGYGVFLDGTGIPNNGHGSVSSSLINHNTYPVYAKNISKGFNFTGNNIFGGTILLESSSGISIKDGIIDVAVIQAIGGGRNHIKGNFINGGEANLEVHDQDQTIINNYRR